MKERWTRCKNDPRVIEVYLGEAPSITPQQMRILRIAGLMAWADGNIASEELQVILSRLSREFAGDRADSRNSYAMNYAPISLKSWH